jgi:acetyl-CoA acetyltransferase
VTPDTDAHKTNVVTRVTPRKRASGRIEINEAFAAIVVALIGELGLPEDIVNFEGGMIVHGLRIG